MERAKEDATIIELMDWIVTQGMREEQWLRAMKLLRYDSADVVEIAERLLEDGWQEDIESLVLASRLLAGKNV
jgi:hypothetical protein